METSGKLRENPEKSKIGEDPGRSGEIPESSGKALVESSSGSSRDVLWRLSGGPSETIYAFKFWDQLEKESTYFVLCFSVESDATECFAAEW